MGRRVRRLLALVVAVAALVGATAVWAVAAEPDWYVRLRYPLRYETVIRSHAETYGLDPALVAAVIHTESRFRPTTRSPAGAVGLMQLLPETAQGIATRTGGGRFTTADLDDPEINIRYGCWYLRHLRTRYARYANAEDLALAAYNAGQTNVDRWLARTPRGRPVAIPFPETRDYVRRVRHAQELYRRAWRL
jgi:soluble lytic murein transglycosylase